MKILSIIFLMAAFSLQAQYTLRVASDNEIRKLKEWKSNHAEDRVKTAHKNLLLTENRSLVVCFADSLTVTAVRICSAEFRKKMIHRNLVSESVHLKGICG